MPDANDSFVMNKSFDELNNFVETGSFDAVTPRGGIERRATTENSGRTRPKF